MISKYLIDTEYVSTNETKRLLYNTVTAGDVRSRPAQITGICAIESTHHIALNDAYLYDER